MFASHRSVDLGHFALCQYSLNHHIYLKLISMRKYSLAGQGSHAASPHCCLNSGILHSGIPCSGIPCSLAVSASWQPLLSGKSALWPYKDLGYCECQ